MKRAKKTNKYTKVILFILFLFALLWLASKNIDGWIEEYENNQEEAE